MATSTVPVSNAAGNNQTSPSSNMLMKPPTAASGGAVPGSASPVAGIAPVQSNTFVPVTPGSVLPGAGAGAGSVPNAGGEIQSPANTFGTSGAMNKQLSDIFGAGIGGDLGNLLGSIGGTDSATLQEYIKSLAPQEATQQATLDAGLGASGVGANSSVAGIADANLKAQEFASIAGESANLTQSGQQLQANVLGGMQNAAVNQVNQSGWDVFGQVMGAGAQLAGKAVSAAGATGGFGALFGM